MDTALIVARGFLAGVFLLASVTKLADLPGSRAAMTDFRVPSRFVGAAAIGLPLLELAAALLVVLGTTARAGAALALVLLGAFVVGIEQAVRAGRAPQCHCFGQIHSAPASRRTTVRNLLFAVPAAFVLLAGPGPEVWSWAEEEGATSAALVATSCATALLGLTTFLLWRGGGRGEGTAAVPDYEPPLPAGSALPTFSVRTLDGERVDGSVLTAGGRGLLIFVSATCGPCHAMLPDAARWSELLGDRLVLHVLSSGDPGENRDLAAETGARLLLDRNAETGRAFRVQATPTAIAYDPTGHVVGEPAVGALAIEALIRRTLKRPEGEAPFDLAIRRG